MEDRSTSIVASPPETQVAHSTAPTTLSPADATALVSVGGC